METWIVFGWIYSAMIAMSFWESDVEKRNAWDKGKAGWKVRILGFKLTEYHFYLFYVMFPLFLTLPFMIYGWDLRILGIVASAYFSGIVLEDFTWYVVNPKVKLKEFYSKFSDYYPWIKVGKKKIIPWGYVINLAIAALFWFFLWRS